MRDQKPVGVRHLYSWAVATARFRFIASESLILRQRSRNRHRLVSGASLSAGGTRVGGPYSPEIAVTPSHLMPLINLNSSQPLLIKKLSGEVRPSCMRQEMATKTCHQCGRGFGLIRYRYGAKQFCRKACRAAYLQRTADQVKKLRAWQDFLKSKANSSSKSNRP